MNSLKYILFILCSASALLYVDDTSVFSYFYTLGLLYILNYFISAKNFGKNFVYFHYFLAVAIVIFAVQRYLIPGYLGMTGPENGIGTDDCRFYAQLVDGQVNYPILFNFNQTFPFVKLLRFVYPFPIYTPLNIVIVNLLGIVFLPYYVYALSLNYTKNKDVAGLAEKLILFCPFTTFYGCIIMRDILIVTAIVAGLYYFSVKKYIPFFICLALIMFVRFGSVVFLAIGIIILFREYLYTHFRRRISARILMLIMLLIVIVGFNIFFPYLQEFSGGKLEGGLFRSNFSSKLERMDSNAFLLRLMELPLLLRTVSLTLFFFFSPFLKFKVFVGGIFSMTKVFTILLTPLFFFFLWKGILQVTFQGLLLYKTNKKLRSVIYLAILFALCLGTVSLQIRHKSVLFPILCILAACGFSLKNKKSYNTLSIVLTAFIIAIQLIFT